MHPDVAVVIAGLDADRAKFETFCRSLSLEELARPVPNSTWIVKDFISHLATIDKTVEVMFRSVHAGTQGAPREGSGLAGGIDTWNDKQVADRREKSVDQILAEAAATRASIEDAMAQFTQSDLDYEMSFGGDSKRPPSKVQMGQYLRGWAKHDPMHAVDMMRAVPERQSPELEAWFDDPAIRRYQAAMNT